MILYYRVFRKRIKIFLPDEEFILPKSIQCLVGYYTFDSSDTADVVFHFDKKMEKELNFLFNKNDCKNVHKSYVQPTKEYSLIGNYKNGEDTFFYYRDHYFITYNFSNNYVNFKYTNKFYNIMELLIEFFKYICLRILVDSKMIPFHSSSIICNKTNKAILMIGDSGSGKSSLSVITSLYFESAFVSDEISFIDDNFYVCGSGNKIKLCKEMLSDMHKKGIDVGYEKLGDEYIVDPQCFLENAVKDQEAYSLSKIILLKQDNNSNNIIEQIPDFIEKYSTLAKNSYGMSNFSYSQKIHILNRIKDISKHIMCKKIIYPIYMINEAAKIIMEC